MNSTEDARQILENYVSSAKIMQLATLHEDGPWMSQVWYSPGFGPDRLYFTSNPVRNHSKQIDADPRVAGAILTQPPESLGEPVQGVVFRGTAGVVKDSDLDVAVTNFQSRWPRATQWITVEGIRSGQSRNRLYEVIIEEWVLHDEIHFPTDPRQVITAQ